MDDFERAQESEQREREIALKEHQARTATTARDECADCDQPLEQHRRPYGTCVECQTIREKRARHFRHD